MSNLLKSKFLFGVMVVTVMFAGVALVATSADAAITMTLRQGMSNSQVQELQQNLNSAGFTVSSSGAGSMGAESMYFGSKTKAAVMAYQASKGLTADGIFGPMSRAAWTGGSMGGLPAGCTSTSGFSPTTGMACNSGGTIVLPAGCSSTSGFSPTTVASCATGVVNAGGPVVAMLSADTPASGTVVATQATADIAHFTFTGSGTVTGVTLKRLGISGDSTLSNVYLFDGATRLTDAASVSSNGVISFNVPGGIFTVNGSKTISVKSDILTGTSGQTVGVMLATFTTSGGTVTANLSGNIHTVASATLAAVSAGTVTPTGATLNPGANVTVWQSTLSVSNRDVWMKRLALRNTGSAPASAFQNFKLYVSGVVVGTATGLDVNGYVTFDLSAAPVLLVAGSRIVRVDVDLVSGASRTALFSLRQAADVDFVDSNFGVNIAPTSTPWASATANTISGTSGGSLTIEKDITSPSTNVINQGSDANIATFKFTAYGEAIKVETLRATYASSDAAIGSLRNGRILIGGVQYGSSTTLNEDSQGTPYTSYTVNYTFMPGVPVLVELHADIYDNDGTDSITAGTDTINGSLAIGSSNATRQDSLGSFNAPAVAVTSNTLTISTASITLTRNGTYATAQTTVLPSTNFKIGSWNLAGSSVEDVLLTTLGFDINESTGTAFDEGDITNMYAVVKNSSGAIVAQPSPIATLSTGGQDNNFSINYTLLKNTNITIELFANLADDTQDDTASTASGSALAIVATDAFQAIFMISGTSMVSGASVTSGDGSTTVAGQTIAFAAATITATVDPSSPVAGITYDNQTVTSEALKFAAVTAGFNITDLTFTLPAAGATVVQNVMLYDDATLVATAPGGATTVTFSGLTWNVPANTNKVLTVKLQLGTVGVGAGTTNASLITTLTAFTAVNTSTGVSATGTESDPAGAALNAFAAIPTIDVVALASTTLLNTSARPLVRFTMTANGGTIAWDQLTFKVTKDAATTVGTDATTGITLWDVTGGGNTSIAGTFTNAATVFGAGAGPADIGFVPTAEQTVAASKTYELRGNIAAADAAGDFVTTTLDNDSSAIVASGTVAVRLAADTDAPLIWSDMSAASHDTTTTDWTTDFGVKNLPVSGSMNWPA
ncbi:hypothetical protein A3G98_00305 [Candidatus Nomurabacteria bacterium RIFCSPLOWO2_12_FULL_37_8]|uniref:Peptidoglycan binding-like domain-containing protein n=1 Tax=Candidatus Nomurabacteria bacterium RIFCSPLOWO2_12_FULL_37_8 TaxID=1801793 RepID=A0A1F6Y6K3_9BACT|nr:MAG: hypothetical protein A3G98_00305 [Candidatus Nomurabacteria bacterium RIFCSPLOWO2_12_FULL_37_8]